MHYSYTPSSSIKFKLEANLCRILKFFCDKNFKKMLFFGGSRKSLSMKKINKTERSWILYDWANSVYSTIIQVAIFPLWFGQLTAGAGLSKVETTFWWGAANTISAIFMAISASFWGTLSDYKGMRLKMFKFFLILGVSSTFLLVFPSSQTWFLAVLFYILTLIGFSGANIFYDASLKDVTEDSRMNKISSLGFAYGYIGGSTIPFILSLAVIIYLSQMDLSNGIPAKAAYFSFYHYSFVVVVFFYSLFAKCCANEFY